MQILVNETQLVSFSNGKIIDKLFKIRQKVFGHFLAFDYFKGSGFHKKGTFLLHYSMFKAIYKIFEKSIK